MLEILTEQIEPLNIKQFKHGASKELFAFFLPYTFQQLDEAARNAKAADLWQVLGIIQDVWKYKLKNNIQ